MKKLLVGLTIVVSMTSFASDCTYKLNPGLEGDMTVNDIVELRKNMRELGASYSKSSPNTLFHEYEDLGTGRSYNIFASEFGNYEKHRDTYMLLKDATSDLSMKVTENRKHLITEHVRWDAVIDWKVNKLNCNKIKKEKIRTTSLSVGSIVPVKVWLKNANDPIYVDYRITNMRQNKYRGGEVYKIEIVDKDTDQSNFSERLREYIWPDQIEKSFLKQHLSID